MALTPLQQYIVSQVQSVLASQFAGYTLVNIGGRIGSLETLLSNTRVHWLHLTVASNPSIGIAIFTTLDNLPTIEIIS